jgi:hypothetical protein
MIPYWLFFFVPVVAFLYPGRSAPQTQRFFIISIGFFFSAVIGLRYGVGGDWGNYLVHLRRVSSFTFFEALQHGDPGYYLLNWLAARSGLGIYLVNFVCAIAVMTGVVRFALRQPVPWIALFVAVPYLLIVVAMGYTRQSAALGFLFIGLAALSDGKYRTFVFWIVLGATFHKSVVIMLPLAALTSDSRRLWNFLWVGVISLLAAYFFVFDSADTLWENYVEAEYESQGGLIRVTMNAMPAILFLAFRRRFHLAPMEERLWMWISVFSLFCIPLVLISSTATDRVALYLIPLQLLVFSRLHLISSDGMVRAFIVVAIIAYYGLVQFVWLNFASHAHAWLPYQMYPFAS